MRLNKRDIFEGCSSCNDERINELLQRLKEELDPDFLPGLYDPEQPFGPDGGIDSDGDGVPDWIEILKGSDPNDPNSKPATREPEDLFFETYEDFIEWKNSLPEWLQILLEIILIEGGILLVSGPHGGLVLGARAMLWLTRILRAWEIYDFAELARLIAEFALEFLGYESNLYDLAVCLLSGGSNCFDAYKPEDFDITDHNPLNQKQFPDAAPSQPKPIVQPAPWLPDDLPNPTQPFGPGGNNPIP